jgi:hypothetical protein
MSIDERKSRGITGNTGGKTVEKKRRKEANFNCWKMARIITKTVHL